MKIKKIFSLLTGVLMISSVIFSPSVNYTEKTLVQLVTADAVASDFTSGQAVAWANNCAATKWNKDVDGAYGTQCVDLILAYYSYLGVSRSKGNATDYQSNTLPSGWKRVKSSPKPGDVIVWAGNTKINSSYTLSQYGHIGIVVAVSGNKLTTVETNADGKVSYAQKVSRDASYAACFIRPNFSGSCSYCTDMNNSDYYIKNSSTGTYMKAAGASNAAGLSLAAKKTSNEFKLALSGSKANGYYLGTHLNKGYVVNPYSDNPTNGTLINIYKKDNSGTQLWEFDKSGNGYIIHLKNNSNLCITANGTGMVLKNRTGNADQIWIVEPVANPTTTTVPVTTVTTTVKTTTTTEIITTVPKPELSTDVSELTILVGEQYTIKANQDNITYKSSNTDVAIVSTSGVITPISSGNAVITVYNTDGDAVQIKLTVIDHIKGDVNEDNKLTIADATMLQKWILGSGKLINWQNADLCKDGVIDIFDMIEMRKIIIEDSSVSEQ